MNALITAARKKYHESLIADNILTIDSKGIPSNADKSSRLSISISRHIIENLTAETHDKITGQSSGAKFETANMQFLCDTFLHLEHLRPGKWHIEKLGNRNNIKTSSFIQYEHLDYLNNIARRDSQLAATLGNDYMVAPDIVIFREPEPDDIINSARTIVDQKTCTLADIRKCNNQLPILHASISAKWTMRSDRAQNSRTEALGVIRNRKGKLPHITVVTGEPLPSRLASLALGTGDIDCLYHFALYELIEAVHTFNAEEANDMLDILITGKRLKDISDLPLDLAI